MENNGELQADFRFSLFEYFYSCDRGGGGGEEERTRQHHHPHQYVASSSRPFDRIQGITPFRHTRRNARSPRNVVLYCLLHAIFLEFLVACIRNVSVSTGEEGEKPNTLPLSRTSMSSVVWTNFGNKRSCR